MYFYLLFCAQRSLGGSFIIRFGLCFFFFVLGGASKSLEFTKRGASLLFLGPGTTPEFTLRGDSWLPDSLGRGWPCPTSHGLEHWDCEPLRSPSLGAGVGTEFHHVASDSVNHTYRRTPVKTLNYPTCQRAMRPGFRGETSSHMSLHWGGPDLCPLNNSVIILTSVALS